MIVYVINANYPRLYLCARASLIHVHAHDKLATWRIRLVAYFSIKGLNRPASSKVFHETEVALHEAACPESKPRDARHAPLTHCSL